MCILHSAFCSKLFVQAVQCAVLSTILGQPVRFESKRDELQKKINALLEPRHLLASRIAKEMGGLLILLSGLSCLHIPPGTYL